MKYHIFLLISISLITYPPNNRALFAQNKPEFEKMTRGIDSDTILVNEYMAKAEKLNEEAKYDSSNFYLRRAIGIIKNANIQNDDSKLWAKFIQIYNGIGTNYIEKGDYQEAFENLRISLNKGVEIFGENHRNVADIYNNLGYLYDMKGEFKKALEYYKMSFQIRFNTLGANHPKVGKSYNNIGDVYSSMGDYEKAFEYYKKSLKILLNEHGENNLDVGTLYNNIAGVFYRKGDYEKALEYLKKSLDIKLDMLGENHPDVALSYNNIGSVYEDKGNYEKALEYYQKCLNIELKTFAEIHPSVASSYNSIGSLYSSKGDYEKAINYYKKSLNIRLSILRDDHPDMADSYNNIGTVYYRKGDYDNALKYFKKSLNIDLKGLGENHPYVALSLNNIGAVYNKKGDYDNALEYYQKSLNIRLNALGENHPDVATSYNNIGTVYSQKQESNKALEYFEKSLNIKIEIFGDIHPTVATSYNNIAYVYKNNGDYEKAIEYTQKSLNILLEKLGDNHPLVASLYNNIGVLYEYKGDYEKALEYIQKSLNIRIKTFGNNHPDVADSYNNIGSVYEKKYAFDKAFEFYQKGIMASSEDFNNFDIYINPNLKNISPNQILLSSLTKKASAFFKIYTSKSKDNKDIITAYATYQIAVALIDTIRGGFQAEGSKLFLAEQASKVYNQAIRTSLTLYDITSEKQYKEQAFILSEKSKSAVLWEALSGAKAKEFGGIPDQLLEKERTLRIDLAFYETQIQKLKQKKDQQDTDLINEFEARQFDLKREYENLIVKFEKEYSKYYDLKYKTETASVIDIQKTLDNQTCMVEYFIGDSSLYIFTISKDDYDVFALAVDSTFIPLLNSYYNAISKYDRRSFAESSHRLYQTLIKPIEDKITGKEKLLIIPDGLLYSIPFEALICQAAGSDDFSRLNYLINQYDISYHYSTNLWLRGLKTASPRKDDSFIAFAPVFSDKLKNSYIASRSTDQLNLTEIDVNYLRSNSISEEGNRKKFIPLPASEEEVNSIANLFEQKNSTADLYLHQEAKEEHLKTKARDYKYVHIATHGWMDEERPKLSGIAFSQPIDTVFQDDGILYSGEMYNLELNADLVVLSACESGLGKLIKGEGPLSLTRGLLYSGANNIIISLWAVSDIYTGELMVELYKNILNGEAYSKALRKAKLKMIGNEQSAFPAKWSGFVLVGR